METRTIILTPFDTNLSGKYRAGEIILVKCDAINEAFTISVPDAKNIRDTLFYFKKTDSSSNVITLSLSEGQLIDGAQTFALSAQYTSVGLLSDGSNFLKISTVGIGGGGVSDHGSLTGLSDDDHTQYLLANGSRGLSGNWNAGSYNITAQGLTLGGLTQGSIPFAGSGGIISQDNSDFFRNISTSKYGIGMNTPADAKLNIRHAGFQLRLEYDATKYSRIYTNSAGDCVLSSATNYVQIEGTNAYLRMAGSGITAGTILPNGDNKHWYFFGGTNGTSPYMVFVGKNNTAWSPGVWVMLTSPSSKFEVTDSNSSANPLFQVIQGSNVSVSKDNRYLTFGTGKDCGIKYDGTDMILDSRLVGSGNFKFVNGNMYIVVKSGATQGGAGASAGEVWKTASHATLPDNVLMIGI